MEVLALIPAKGTSNRIPGKNFRKLAGKPLVQWTIEAALGANTVTRTIVSTEHPQIAELAESLGAEVQMRPRRLAKDPAQANDVACYVVERLCSDGYSPDAVVMLLPTSPFRTAEHIDEAVALWVETGENVHSAHLVWGFADKFPGVKKIAVPNGAIWVADPCRIVADGYFAPGPTYLLDHDAALDIDRPADWAAAEWIANTRNSKTWVFPAA